MARDVWSDQQPVVMKASADGLCYYRCLLHCVSAFVPEIPQGLNYLRGNDMEVLQAVDKFRKLYSMLLDYLARDKTDDIWMRVNVLLGRDLVAWKQRMCTKVSTLRHLISNGDIEPEDIWADELTVEMTPLLFAHAHGLNLHLHIHRQDQQPLFLSSKVAENKPMVIVELQYENNNHYNVVV